MRGAARYALVAAVALGLSVCRDDPAAFEVQVPTNPPEGTFRLTLSPFDDAGPAWTPDGLEVVYSAGQTDLFPDAAGAIVAVEADGGQARAVAQAYQDAVTFPNIVAPALSPDGTRLAAVELRFTFPLFCAGMELLDCGEFAPTDVPAPELGVVVVTVRDVDGGADGPEVFIDFPDARREGPGAPIYESDPYQRFYSLGGLPFRPTWSSDGKRLAYSDGKALYVWEPGVGNPEVVLSAEQIVSPAWSPDGTQIAFVQLTPQPTDSFFCICGTDSSTAATRIVTGIFEHWLSLLDVATGQVTLLDPLSRDPAWSPDGAFLYVSRRGSLWRVPVDDTGALEPILGTDGARHPAVSPEGDRLAYTLFGESGLGDIWIMPLEGSQ